MRLPVSVVKELLGRKAEEARWNPEAIEAAGLEAESFLADLGVRAYGLTQASGRKTVYKEDVETAAKAASAPSAPAVADKPSLVDANRKLAQENARLKMELAKVRKKE